MQPKIVIKLAYAELVGSLERTYTSWHWLHYILKSKQETQLEQHDDEIKSAKECRVIAIASGGQDVVSNNMANGAPSQDINNVESNRVIGFEEADILLGTCITSLKVCEAVLLRHLLCHVLPLEVEEHKPSQEEGEASAEAYHKGWVEFSSNTTLWNNPFGGGAHFGWWGFGEPCEGSKTLEAHVGWLQMMVLLDGWR